MRLKGFQEDVPRRCVRHPAFITTLCRIEPRDLQVAREAPPPPTFTVPAIQHRTHRGGESIFLKDTYPSGFYPSKSPELPLPPTDTSCGGQHHIALSGCDNQSLVLEERGFGVPPWGGAASRRVLSITRVVVGAEVVADTVGSELVQFGPGFPCGAIDGDISPRRRSHRARATTPLSPTSVTIDGSTLRGRNLLVALRMNRDNQWPQRRRVSPNFRSPPRTRDRTGTGQRVSSAGPTPWPTPIESGNEPFSRLASEDSDLADSSSKEEVVNGDRRLETANIDGVGAGRSEVRADAEGHAGDRTLDIAEDDGGRLATALDTSRDSASGEGGEADALEDSLYHVGKENLARPMKSGHIVGAPLVREDVRYQRIESRGVGAALVDEESEKLGGAWTIAGDGGTVCQEENICSVASIISLEVTTSRSPASECSVRPLAAKRSLSTLDSEGYGGNLSRDATDIVRSHLESRTENPEGSSARFSGRLSPDVFSTDTMMLASPGSPPSPRMLGLDSLLAALPAPTPSGPTPPAAFHLPSMERSRECYVRMRGDVILAVVSKEELLGCVDDIGLRALKAAAHPVCIKANMTLADGIRAISATPTFLQDWSFGGGKDRGEAARTSWRTATLEYFSSRLGTWEAIRSESDWKVLLAAPAGRHGAGVTFRSSNATGRDADFLVAVSRAFLSPQHPPSSTASGTKTSAPPRCVPSTNTLEKKPGWRYPASVTPGEFADRANGCDGGSYLESSVRGRRRDDANRSGMDGQDCLRHRNSSTSAEATPKTVEEESPSELGWQGACVNGRKTPRGPGPGGALWTSRPVDRGMSPERGPKMAKVRHLVRHLEAGLKLKGQPRSGGLPSARSQKIDTPYTKELSKWGYDEILGVPRTVGPGRGSCHEKYRCRNKLTT